MLSGDWQLFFHESLYFKWQQIATEERSTDVSAGVLRT
jgi:hypothetical protein